MSTQFHRKCSKCGLTAAQDMTVPFFRFPKPGKENVLKAKAWAIYCWPDKNWGDVETLHQLHNQSKVLCGRHFEESCFLDSSKNKIGKFAVPGTTQYVVKLMNTLRSQAKLEVPGEREHQQSEPTTSGEATECPDDTELNSDDDDEEVERSLYYPPVPVAFKKKTAPEDPSTEASGEEDAVTAGSSRLHTGYRCDQCRGHIVGPRYCCVECPNYDLCGTCEAAGRHAAHYVLRVPSDKPHVEVIAVLENIRNVLLQREDAENICDQVKVEAPDPAPEPDPLAAAPDTSDEQEEKFTIIEPPPETVPPPPDAVPSSEKRDILGDIVVKLELDAGQLVMESFRTVAEPAVGSHSGRAAPGAMSNIKEYRGGGDDGSRNGSGRGSGSNSGGGEGYAVYTHSAARPAPVLQGSNVTQEKAKGTNSAKRKTNSPPQHAKVKKK